MDKTKCFRRSNSIKKLMGGVLSMVLLGAAGPSLSTGTETLRCEYKLLSGSSKGREGESKIEISGNTLKWFVQSPAPFSKNAKDSYFEFPYKILERNKVGVVAVKSDSLIAPNVGPVIGAQILSIRKSDGALYVGGVGVTGVSEHWKGHCK
jgi:hypothetical protein